MGRKKIELTQEEIERRALSGQRIRNFRNEHDLSQEELAEKLASSAMTIRRYEMNADPKHKGKYPPMPEDVAKLLEIESGGIIADYWMGRTAETTYEGRIAELKCASASDEREAELHRLKAAEIERRKIFFCMCGYGYESIEDTAAADFSPDPRPHILTNHADGSRHELTPEQFKALFDKLQDTINFACFQADKSKQ